MTTDFDADIKNFKEILNKLELKTHTENGYKFSPDAKMAAGWWFLKFTWNKNLLEESLRVI